MEMGDFDEYFGVIDENRSLAEILVVGRSLYACEDSTFAMRG